jgi:hypothetical protein
MIAFVPLRSVLAIGILFAGLEVRCSAQTPVVSVTNAVTTINETGGVAEFLIVKDSGPEATVSFEMIGSAVLGTDYILLGGVRPAVVPSSANVATVAIQVLNDFLNEPDKTITLHLLPGPGYTIGTPASATITLRSDDSAAESRQPRLNIHPTLLPAFNPPIVAPNSTLALDIFTSPSGISGIGTSALVFLDSTVIGRPVFTPSSIYPNFQIFFASPPGLHVLTAVVTKTNAGAQIATQPFRAADAIVQRASLGSMTNAIIADGQSLFTRSNSDPDSSGAFMEFAVPSSATNWKSALFMAALGSGSHQLSTYRGDGVVSTNDLAASADLVGAFTPSAGNAQLQIDVTRWTQTNAGGYIGFKLQREPGAAEASFYNPVLAFFSNANDVPAQFAWLNFPTNNLFEDKALIVNLETYDPDSQIASVRVFEEVRFAPSTNLVRTNIAVALVNLPPGTNFVSMQCTNISAGAHRFGIEVTTESGTATYFYPSLTFHPAQGDAPVHRWLGTDGDSLSFYLVDAAGRAWVWGDNTNGQLGIGFKSEAITRPVMLRPPAGKRWRQFTSASYCAVGVTDDGVIYGMGQNSGLTSIFQTADPNVPIVLSSAFVRRASLTQRSLWIINQSLKLIQLFGTGGGSQTSFVDLNTGATRVLALDASGNLWYGSDAGGFYNTFEAPVGSAPWKDFSTCATHSLALDSNGGLFGWGQNASGELPLPLGTSTGIPQLIPFPAGVTAWTKVAAGKYVSLLVDQNGRVFSWGKQGYTGSADPYVRSKIVPLQVPADETGWLDIAVGSSFAVALSARGNLYVWGDIPASPSARHVDFPELVSGLPDLLNASATAEAIVTIEPTSIRLSPQFEADMIAPAGSNLTVEASSDLINWVTITNIVNAGPKTRVTAPVTGDANLFIRVR